MLELNAVQKRRYPDIKVGDYVKVYKKKTYYSRNRKTNKNKENNCIVLFVLDFLDFLLGVFDFPILF